MDICYTVPINENGGPECLLCVNAAVVNKIDVDMLTRSQIDFLVIYIPVHKRP